MQSTGSQSLLQRAGDDTSPHLPEENPLPDLELDWDEESLLSLVDFTSFLQLWYASLVLQVLVSLGVDLFLIDNGRTSRHFDTPPSRVCGGEFKGCRSVFLASTSNRNSSLSSAGTTFPRHIYSGTSRIRTQEKTCPLPISSSASYGL